VVQAQQGKETRAALKERSAAAVVVVQAQPVLVVQVLVMAVTALLDLMAQHTLAAVAAAHGTALQNPQAVLAVVGMVQLLVLEIRLKLALLTRVVAVEALVMLVTETAQVQPVVQELWFYATPIPTERLTLLQVLQQ
jgi:hypothetical protein